MAAAVSYREILLRRIAEDWGRKTYDRCVMKPTELIPLVLALLLGALLLGFMLAWLLNAITLPVG